MNLLPIPMGEAPEVERTFCWRIDRSNRKQWAIRHGKWKYINDGNTMDLLCDLDADIGERRSLTREQPEIVRDLKMRLKAWKDEMDAGERDFIVR